METEDPANAEIDLNWRERMHKALREGKLTTVINYMGTMYSVVLRPYEPNTQASAASTPVQRPQLRTADDLYADMILALPDEAIVALPKDITLEELIRRYPVTYELVRELTRR